MNRVISMSFDGNIIRRLTIEWNDRLTGGRINKIYQINKHDLLFLVHQGGSKHQLLISTSPSYARTYITNDDYEKPDHPPTFGMFLRKQLDGGILRAITQVAHDRVIDIQIDKRNELGDLTHKHLILEMMGRYSNIIVTDDTYKILEAIKHNMPFDGNERTIFPGAIYEPPATTKFDPYDNDMLNAFLADPTNYEFGVMMDQIMGFSPIIVKEILHRFQTNDTPIRDVFEDILHNTNPTIVHAKRDRFSHIDLTHVSGERETFDSVNEMLDAFYHERDQIDVIKQHSKDVTTFTKNYINRLQNKIDKLNNDLQNAADRDQYRVYGELIQANVHQIHKGDTTLDTINYYTNEPVSIPLDNKLTPIQNSEKYFKRYKKMKASIPHIKKQIKEASRELDFFYDIESQFDYATLKDIEEIKQELADKKYLRIKPVKKRKQTPNYDTYKDDDGVTILVGKNHLQNEYLTHQLARHNDVWFHVQNAPGSHVIVRHPFPLSETTIRTAALLAAYHSKMRQSSSVPVDYTMVRHVKKIPGRHPSFVRYTDQKTIYIDPSDEAIKQIKKA